MAEIAIRVEVRYKCFDYSGKIAFLGQLYERGLFSV